ncbi:glutamine--fructose-6-phosphate transaminase (isomerizing) [Clostridium isatidis]|uniref:Glutamine--fructose-6-phosphate aminotransferase [isomerizing] n=1 Tax=Clostridium isatidis TaxID=182773 RepID=A0A343JA15_9CLOT|nr:glutamine--fructose-6-phosphate transaminase (isomerizing) [Clostridium isatidis]ASW42373.1 glutamine--fructose-6-phosphate aminotransferase [Clostridium isatidis]
MCGIVGYLGRNKASEILVEGLSKLEYRGYDSAGIAVLDEGKIDVNKCKGRLANLESKISNKTVKGSLGIGHTRWATHGEPSDVNSHPHTNEAGTIAVVHNGIIENYIELREWLISEGYNFKSQTDTEVIPHLVDYYYNGDLLDAFIKATKKLSGSYAIGIICKDEPNKLIAVRKDSPLIVGVGEEESFIASDIPAILNHTRDIYLLEDNEFVIIDNNGIKILNSDKEEIKKEIFHVTWDANSAEKGGYDHFMLKEIHEQPKAVKDTLAGRITLGEKVKLDDVKISKEELESINRVYIVACGTAYNAGVVGKSILEKTIKLPVETDIASEFRYREPIIDKNTLMIVLSQSGETADTLAAIRLAKENNARVLAITNVVGSSIAREADDVLYTWAGPEIAVASTKAYVTQIITLYIVALYIAEMKGTMTEEEINEIKEGLLGLSDKIATIFKYEDEIKAIAESNKDKEDMYYLGRGLDYAVAMEGSLKTKEISYIHSEAYAAGELKHGTIALIEEGTPVIALATQENLFEKTVSNVREVSTRGAKVLGIAMEGHDTIEKVVDNVIYIPRVSPILAPVLSVVPLQLFSYHIAKARGCDIDKPRNLAKAVTVE